MQVQQTRLAKTQNQLARGTRILAPADDPAGAKRLLDLQQSLALHEQFRANADSAENRLTLEESTLDAASNVLQRVRELALEANTATLTNADRHALGQEVSQRLEELVGLANTKDGNNEYLFSGFATRTRPFSRLLSGFTYNGDDGGRELGIGPELKVPVGDPGSRVFQRIRNGNGTFRTLDQVTNSGTGVIGPGQVSKTSAFVPDTYTITFTSTNAYEVRDSGSNLVASGTYQSGSTIAFNGAEVTITGVPASGDRFQVVPSSNQDVFSTAQALATTLAMNVTNDASQAQLHNAMGRAIEDVDRSLANLDSVRASVGARLNAVDNERFVNEDFALQLKETISATRDVDLTEAVTRLSSERATLEAAQRSFAVIQNLSLFNFF